MAGLLWSRRGTSFPCHSYLFTVSESHSFTLPPCPTPFFSFPSLLCAASASSSSAAAVAAKALHLIIHAAVSACVSLCGNVSA
uniref:Uncharacterized protein n=1 Tax=Physcomitrium patens TaxID=3218 RepID=A0A2K1IY40_PHYPA|nr:hypothetical protein PHYPA_024003 [Physcomitrium patens]